ncbi:unnamed protein product, partial [Medioppia subpectinata]
VKVKLQIWDTAGQERFRSITQSYYRSAHCLMLVYDISSQPSFDSLHQWCRDMEQYAGATGNGNRSVLKVLVGNKCDKDREIPEHIAEQFAVSNEFDLFMETSALQADNVEKLFYEIADVCVQRRQLAGSNGGHESGSAAGVAVGQDNQKSGQSSCFSGCYSG